MGYAKGLARGGRLVFHPDPLIDRFLSSLSEADRAAWINNAIAHTYTTQGAQITSDPPPGGLHDDLIDRLRAGDLTPGLERLIALVGFEGAIAVIDRQKRAGWRTYGQLMQPTTLPVEALKQYLAEEVADADVYGLALEILEGGGHSLRGQNEKNQLRDH